MTEASQAPSSPRSAPRNLLKRVETHVRLYSHLDNFSVSSSSTSLRLRKPTESGGTPQSQSNAGSWTSSFDATRIHRGTPTSQFYEEVIAPCVTNCTSGQSYLFLTTGPPESGRSQTLYGSPHHSEKGLIELTAEDLLRRVAMRQKVLLQASASADKENAGTLPYSSASTAQEEPPSGNMVVTYASFTTMGDVITDTITGEAVQLEEFPPPLGLVPLPEVRLLEDARSAVVLPQTKQSEMSCIVQFYVYAPVGGSGRRSMATLTFVDVTAFRAPLSRELQHLIHTVQAVAGTAPEGSGDANFKNARLTTLLEPALQGYVTLVSITTISGRPEMYDATKAALQFTQDLGAIHQVLILIHIQNPRWFMESAQGIEALRTVREKARLESYSRGVYDYYKTASKWLLENVDNVDTQLERILEETDTVRRGIASEVSGQYRELQARVEEEDKELQEEVRCANTIEQRCEELTARLHEMETSMVRLEQQASQGDVSCGRKISEIQVELSGLESANSTLIEERRRLEKESTIYAQKVDELQGMLNAYA
ncbi:hypothetical protein AGDE_11317 [Angomonas deanei]|nr:hypothetical protein AGDE_11317 [Angomonas deanei]|eukprot:EPY26445.1 hypothetical protein AGDE_11317 [Angomonas deanei]